MDKPTGQTQLLISYPKFFTFYLLRGTYYLELYQLGTASFPLDFSASNWQNVGFTWSENEQTLAVYANGAAISTRTLLTGAAVGDRVASLLANEYYNLQCYLLGSGAAISTGYSSPANMLLKDLVIWQRPFFTCDAHLFLGFTGRQRVLYCTLTGRL